MMKTWMMYHYIHTYIGSVNLSYVSPGFRVCSDSPQITLVKELFIVLRALCCILFKVIYLGTLSRLLECEPNLLFEPKVHRPWALQVGETTVLWRDQ